MRIPKNYFDAANAMLGVEDAVTLASVIESCRKNGTPFPRVVGDRLKTAGRVAFVGNPPVTFVSREETLKAIQAFNKPVRDAKPEDGGNAKADIDAIAQLRKDILSEIAKLRDGINGLRHDNELLRGAQLKDKTEIEKAIDAMVSMMAAFQKEQTK